MTNGDPDFMSIERKVDALSAKVEKLSLRMTGLEARRRTDSDAADRLERKVDRIENLMVQLTGVLNLVRILVAVATAVAAVAAIINLAHNIGVH